MGKKKTTSEFIKDSIKIHGYKYEYNSVEYTNSRTKVKIICPIHGEFFQLPPNHLQGNGCSECFGNHKKDTNYFIKEAISIHGDKYDYRETHYNNTRDKVKIICPIHGEFWQKPESHICGHGCSRCNKFKKTFLHSIWEEFGNKSDSFDSFKVYIIECFDEEERFYKIGKTYSTVGRRFRSTAIPYNWKIIKIFEGNAKYISELEDELHIKYKEHKYVPIKKFGGCTECFDIGISL